MFTQCPSESMFQLRVKEKNAKLNSLMSCKCLCINRQCWRQTGFARLSRPYSITGTTWIEGLVASSFTLAAIYSLARVCVWVSSWWLEIGIKFSIENKCLSSFTYIVRFQFEKKCRSIVSSHNCGVRRSTEYCVFRRAIIDSIKPYSEDCVYCVTPSSFCRRVRFGKKYLRRTLIWIVTSCFGIVVQYIACPYSAPPSSCRPAQMRLRQGLSDWGSHVGSNHVQSPCRSSNKSTAVLSARSSFSGFESVLTLN